MQIQWHTRAEVSRAMPPGCATELRFGETGWASNGTCDGLTRDLTPPRGAQRTTRPSTRERDIKRTHPQTRATMFQTTNKPRNARRTGRYGGLIRYANPTTSPSAGHTHTVPSNGTSWRAHPRFGAIMSHSTDHTRNASGRAADPYAGRMGLPPHSPYLRGNRHASCGLRMSFRQPVRQRSQEDT